MPNEILWLIYLFVDLTLAVVIYRTLGKEGLIGLIVTEIILSNILVMKLINIFGITSTLGNITYATIFFATDILSERYGKKEARRAVWVGFAASVISLVIITFALWLKPAPADTTNKHLLGLFHFYPRVLLASWTAYIISQNHDVWAFHFWRKKTGGRFLWFRNNASTMVSQLIDSVLFVTIAFLGVFPASVFLEVLITTYFVKWIIAAFDTPFIYLAIWWTRKVRVTKEPEILRS